MTVTSSAGQPVSIGTQGLHGELHLPANAQGMVLLGTGPASLPAAEQQQDMAAGLHAHGLGTLVLELMVASQMQGRHPVLDLPLLSDRLLQALQWLGGQNKLSPLPLGMLGMGLGASAALLTCARAPGRVRAVVAHEGRPELAGAHLRQVRVPALWITDDSDTGVLELKRYALRTLPGPKQLEVLSGPNGRHPLVRQCQAAADLAGQWFTTHLPRPH